MSSTEGSKRSRTWVIVGVLLAAGCLVVLCVLLAIGGASAWLIARSVETGGNGYLPQPFASATSTPRPFPTQITPVSSKAEETLRLLGDTEVPMADPVALAERLLWLENVPRVLAEQADPIPVGTTETFWVSDVDNNENFQIDADLVYATDHVYFWVQDGVSYDLEDVRNLVDTFEEEIYPTDRQFFGSEWTPGVDGDPHLYVLYARGLGFSIAGYYSSNDEFSPQVHEYSNGHEMFYLSADNLNLDEEFTYSVLAHEFQHMIHWYLDRNEETWMNEGFSELAAMLNGYDVGGMDYAYASDPDQTLTYWPSEPGTSASHYGQSFLFLAYYLDRFGAEATKALVAHPANGLDSMDRALQELGETDPDTGQPITADDIFRDWAAAMLLQDPDLADGRYAFRSYGSVPQVSINDSFDECPVPEQTREVGQYGVDYIRFKCNGDYTLSFEGLTTVKAVPGDPHSGEYAFWSNKGDESDMTLTRTFDFTGVEGPVSLDYWVWYDIEEGYDYLYLEVSTDGGNRWEIVTTPSGTDEDPSGNAYGWAYNGTSGGGFEPQWIEEQVDLSGYAGQEIQVRFEYITDAAVNGEGLLLDDVRVDAIGYQEDFEAGDGGWEAQGFVRLYNELPQTYRVLLVERGRETSVREIILDADRRAQVPLSIGGGVQDAVLIVIGTTRHTWQPAPYRFSVR